MSYHTYFFLYIIFQIFKYDTIIVKHNLNFLITIEQTFYGESFLQNPNKVLLSYVLLKFSYYSYSLVIFQTTT